MRAIGSDLKRSKTPFSMSSRSWTPVAMQVVRTVWATMPGIINGRYLWTLPEIAPPNT
jgi:hypothetical protein